MRRECAAAAAARSFSSSGSLELHAEAGGGGEGGACKRERVVSSVEERFSSQASPSSLGLRQSHLPPAVLARASRPAPRPTGPPALPGRPARSPLAASTSRMSSGPPSSPSSGSLSASVARNLSEDAAPRSSASRVPPLEALPVPVLPEHACVTSLVYCATRSDHVVGLCDSTKVALQRGHAILAPTFPGPPAVGSDDGEPGLFNPETAAHRRRGRPPKRRKLRRAATAAPHLVADDALAAKHVNSADAAPGDPPVHPAGPPSPASVWASCPVAPRGLLSTSCVPPPPRLVTWGLVERADIHWISLGDAQRFYARALLDFLLSQLHYDANSGPANALPRRKGPQGGAPAASASSSPSTLSAESSLASVAASPGAERQGRSQAVSPASVASPPAPSEPASAAAPPRSYSPPLSCSSPLATSSPSLWRPQQAGSPPELAASASASAELLKEAEALPAAAGSAQPVAESPGSPQTRRPEWRTLRSSNEPFRLSTEARDTS
ncbi:hypothetical protein BESB_083170 [Besnoitia besnoiti]|uniref:Uncharacterized protein n=1 Tax=Besnoitia besnoiti TaxID=94643 RepID=A0A2A9M3Q6_BESBE|nr:hypothetical protein BESB_083170 [Besnoitia besnoiti]PFH33118.1 hypothetical protein BESB_083170 [Besnoitia besnoiti]